MKTLQKDRIMLRSLKERLGHSLQAIDGEIGKCVDFLFDDEKWTIRYLVAVTRKWLPGRRVLIAPHQFADQALGDDRQHFQIALPREKIKNAPPLANDSPVSHQYQLELARHYQYQPHWTGSAPWTGAILPAMIESAPLAAEEQERHAEDVRRIDQHPLRSVQEVFGYNILAPDGEIGKVSDFVAETGTWTVRWIMVDTGQRLSGRKVLISPDWIKNLSWSARRVDLDLPISQIGQAPEFDHRLPVNREYEGRLYDYYGRPRYWK